MNTKQKQSETAAAAPEAPRTDCTHNRMIKTRDNPTWAWQCADCGYIYGKHGTPKPNFAAAKPAHTPGYVMSEENLPHYKFPAGELLNKRLVHLIAAATQAADWLSRSTRIDDREQAEDLRAAIAAATGENK